MFSANGSGHSNGSQSSGRNYMLLELSSKVEYALLALLELASQPARKHPLTIGEISAKQPIPERYLEQILTNLRRGGIVHSQRGSKGGFVLSREPWQITLFEVVALVEGDRKEKDPSETITLERELVREVWQQASHAAQAVLDDCTLQDLCQKRDTQSQKNPMYYI